MTSTLQTSADATIRTTFMLLWVLAVIVILIAGQWWGPVHDFRDKMLRQWKPSLVIGLLCLFGIMIGGKGFLPIPSIGIFCQAMIGLTLAYGIVGYEPLPVTQTVIRKEKPIEHMGLMLGAVLAIVITALIISGLLWGVLLQIFGETMNNPQGVVSVFPHNAWRTFFFLLAGAGIAEETTYRLVFLSLFWRLTRRPWVAIILSTLLHAAYHLSPLDAVYRQFWDHPITIFASSTLMGIVMGYVYLKRGYETVVLGHTLGDWVPFLLSRVI